MRRRWHVVAVVVATSCALAPGCGRIAFDDRPRADASDVTDMLADVPPDAELPVRVAYIKPTNTEAFDTFGYSVALSPDGSTLAVGAPQEDSPATTINGSQLNGASQAGAVYIFVRTGTTWTQQAYIKPSNAGMADLFGWSVALSSQGNTLVVGAPLEDSDATGINSVSQGDAAMGMDSGAAYVFTRNGTTWSQQAYVKASNTDPGDDFGVSVAISADGNTLAVGAGNEESGSTGIDQNQTDDSVPLAGAVFVFTRFGTVWTQQAYIKASNTDAGDLFGTYVALATDGNTLAVCAPEEDSTANTINGNEADDSAPEAGAIYMFTRSGTTWSQQAYIKPSEANTGDFFGKRLSLGANGNALVASAAGEDSTVANSGAAFIFVRTGSVWSEVKKLKAPNADNNDQFGAEVVFTGDGNRVGIAAPFEDSATSTDMTDNTSMDSGAVYVFAIDGGAWTFEAYFKALMRTPGDQFGNAVASSADGSTSAYAAFREDSSTTGIDSTPDENAQDSGAVYVLYR